MKLKSALMCSTLVFAALPALAEEKRALDAHVHGHGALNVAVEGGALLMELEVPGFDIVGFEHAATSDADKAAVEAALAKLSNPSEIFALPAAAGCTVSEVAAELHGDEDHGDHDDHDHDDHAEHEEHDHDDHKDDHDAHDHEEHADHDDHDHKDDHGDHDEHDHDDHDSHGHEEHAGESHSEFHASYAFTCENVANLDSITLSYFNVFPNAEELEVQVVTESGATKQEATGAAPVVTLN